MAYSFHGLAVLALVAAAFAQQYTTPVPILRQINKHNDDGSYSYGYEGADGSFKIETKYPNGEVYGKYGYVDDQGKTREIEYGATKRGFEPVGTDITVAPPTLRNDNNVDYDDDGQYREDPSVYYKEHSSSSSARRPSSTHAAGFTSFNLPSTGRTQQRYHAPQPTHHAQQPAYHAPQPAYHAPQTYHAPQHHQSFYNHVPIRSPAANFPGGHPAITSFDVNTGSYSLTYTG